MSSPRLALVALIAIALAAFAFLDTGPPRLLTTPTTPDVDGDASETPRERGSDRGRSELPQVSEKSPSPSEDEEGDRDPRPVITELSEAQAESMIRECLEPKLQAGAQQSGDYGKKLMRKVPGDHPSFYDLSHMAKELDNLNSALETEKNIELINRIRSGDLGRRAVSKKTFSDPGVYGTLSWGAPPGEVWGVHGAKVRIPYAFKFDEFPRLKKANGDFDRRLREFESMLEDR